MTRHGFETFTHEGWQDDSPLADQGGIKLSCRLTIFLFRDSHGGTEGALKQRQSSAVWEQAREWRKSSRIEKNGRGGSPSGLKLQARTRRLTKPKPPAEAPGRRGGSY